MNRMILITLLLTLAAVSAQAAPPTEAAHAEAKRALDSLRQAADPEGQRALGLEKADEARAATLGEPVPVYMIRLDQLQQYQGEEASRLLVDLQLRVYPVTVGGQARSVVEVRAQGGRWEVARLGGAQKSRLLERGRRSAMAASHMASSDFFEVRIPALNKLFLGHHEASGLQLTPLVDEPALGLVAGRPERAEKVLSLLVPLAREVPRDMP